MLETVFAFLLVCMHEPGTLKAYEAPELFWGVGIAQRTLRDGALLFLGMGVSRLRRRVLAQDSKLP